MNRRGGVASAVAMVISTFVVCRMPAMASKSASSCCGARGECVWPYGCGGNI